MILAIWHRAVQCGEQAATGPMGRKPSPLAGPEPAAGEKAWEEEKWEDGSVGKWVAGTGANLEEAAAGARLVLSQIQSLLLMSPGGR